jgi:hypothetical protein
MRPRAETLIDPFELKAHLPHGISPSAAATGSVPERAPPLESPRPDISPVEVNLRDVVAQEALQRVAAAPAALGGAARVPARAPAVLPVRGPSGEAAALLARRWPLVARSLRARCWCSED